MQDQNQTGDEMLCPPIFFRSPMRRKHKTRVHRMTVFSVIRAGDLLRQPRYWIPLPWNMSNRRYRNVPADAVSAATTRIHVIPIEAVVICSYVHKLFQPGSNPR
jgi:hypothetical protein